MMNAGTRMPFSTTLPVRIGRSFSRQRWNTQSSGTGMPAVVTASPAMCVRQPRATTQGSQAGLGLCASSSHAPPHDSTRLPTTVFSTRPGMAKFSARRARPIARASSSRPDQNAPAAATASAPNASGPRTASWVPQRWPCASRPIAPDGTSVIGPHMSDTVDPEWSRSGSIANPPAAATQATCETVPCTGAHGSVAAPAAGPEGPRCAPRWGSAQQGRLLAAVRSGGSQCYRGAARLLLVGVGAAAGQPGGQPLDGHLEVGELVDERLHLVGQPGEGDLLLAPPVGQLLQAPVGEVHRRWSAAGLSPRTPRRPAAAARRRAPSPSRRPGWPTRGG